MSDEDHSDVSDVAVVPQNDVCVLAGNVSDVAWSGLIGKRVRILDEQAVALSRQIAAVEWPTQSRKAIHGKGTAVGATYEPTSGLLDKARL